jgi:hypothetical protein
VQPCLITTIMLHLPQQLTKIESLWVHFSSIRECVGGCKPINRQDQEIKG